MSDFIEGLDETELLTARKRDKKREKTFKAHGISYGHVLVHYGGAIAVRGHTMFCALCKHWFFYDRKLPVLNLCEMGNVKTAPSIVKTVQKRRRVIKK